MPSACFRSSGPGLEAVNSTTTIILLTLVESEIIVRQGFQGSLYYMPGDVVGELKEKV